MKTGVLFRLCGRRPEMKFTKILLLLAVLGFIAAGAFAPGHARASLLGDLFAKKQVDAPPLYPIQHEDEFLEVAKAYHVTPYNDPELEFEIWVPQDWEYQETAQAHDTLSSSHDLMGDLARWKSPIINTMQAVVTVQSIKLDREISAENWLRKYILENNYDMEAITSDNEKKASASCTSAVDGRSSYSYITVQINGNNAVIVRFEAPLPLKEAMAPVGKMILDKFKFILETDRPIEAQKIFSFADAVKFKYPESLIPKQVDVKDTRHMSMQLYNMRKAPTSSAAS